VSLLRGDRVTAFVGPQSVLVQRDFAAWRRRRPVMAQVPCDPESPDRKWASIASALDRALVAVGTAGRLRGRVNVSSQFVRFTLLAPVANVFAPAALAALAQQQLRLAYGEQSREWRLCVDSPRPGAPALAAAIEPELRTVLHETLSRRGVTVRSMTPSLAAAFNAHRSRLGKRGSFWFALAEPGRLCVAYSRAGDWVAVRNHATGGPLSDALPLVLERMYMGEANGAEPGPVYVAGDPGSLAGLELALPWSVQRLAFPLPGAECVTRS
jgi:hypothetical protein